MIPYDQFTRAVIALLILLGLVGLVQPALFIYITRFPRVDLRGGRRGIPRGEYGRARLWALLSILGAGLLYALARA